MKKSLVLLVVLAAVLAASCQRPPLKVAVLASMGGVREAAQLAVDEWNARGGVLGRSVTMIFKGTSGDYPQTAAQAAREVISKDHVRYIVGDIYSRLSISISEIANPAKVIQVTPASTNAAVTVDGAGATKAYVFRACFSDPAQGKMAAAFAVDKLKAARAFVLSDPNDIYVAGLAEAFTTGFAGRGGMVVGKETYSARDVDFSRAVAAIRGARPDIVYMPALSAQAVNFANEEARAKGITAPFMGGDGWDDNESIDLRVLEGNYYTTHYRVGDPRPEAQVFEKAFRARYMNEPTFVAALTYDAMNLLLTAIRTAGKDDTDAVRAALEKISFEGITGRITMDAQHNAVKPAVVLQVKGGRVIFDSMVAP